MLSGAHPPYGYVDTLGGVTKATRERGNLASTGDFVFENDNSLGDALMLW